MFGLNEAKGDLLEKEKKSNTDDCACFLEMICLVDGLEKETGNFYHHTFCGKLPRCK